jgi:hypothetical protein
MTATPPSRSNSCAFCAPGCPTFFIGDGMCDVPCMTEPCSYDNGDCGTRYDAATCHGCDSGRCRDCFLYGSGTCVGCAIDFRGCVEECTVCSQCQACAVCYGGSATRGSCSEDPQTVAAVAKEVEMACVQGVMANSPSCDGPCRAALQAARSGECWESVHAAASPGLFAVVLQVCGVRRSSLLLPL